MGDRRSERVVRSRLEVKYVIGILESLHNSLNNGGGGKFDSAWSPPVNALVLYAACMRQEVAEST